MIDWDRVAELRDGIGEADFAEVVELFLEEADEVVAGLASLDSAESRQAALHFLKGSALNLGFQDLARLCQQGEKAREMPPEALSGLIDCYRRSRDGFVTRLRAASAA
ncbi:MAG: Hpt domain-containing protein [Pseudorhodobacter sp.]